ncbi:Chondroitin proteoglycan 9 [Caenorhabditis elegans]|uniref:Chondroitin proteoglycan 9 n=1 Tax=Caenorhabditis elegans TaxID=6239 RepID=CPG9_CAEEL|nr:Chondroitin proteoglycan 9 [Caenorhabditis elegans]Q95XP7.1 RecName: Full=Chondroitin proteoglycan 9; Flags: Precursor [Caenorhabditis elegans]ABC65819.1 chondroitin proteoglycan-9 [Caenorhabditis elegans]CCD74097.1 Chondroitin proteoglycan 9 [Caenorhabditis elegans]|eukprot:NP_500289.1 Chondroitin proteoglycan 9 [Caenorhabditis elegans]
MHLWQLVLLVILFFGAAFGADLEGSGSGDVSTDAKEAILNAQTLLDAVSSDGSGADVEASGEDVQTFFF